MIYTISGPSGVGKTTILQMLKEVLPVTFPVSATDRMPRPGEVEGISYYYVTPEEFDRLIASNAFVEFTELEHRYGVLRSELENTSDNIILDLDVNGAMKIREYYPDVILIFIAPPSMDELERRLRARNDGMDECELNRRIMRAEQELSCVEYYDFVFTNYSVQQAFEEVLNIIRKFCENK